jgi:hypothetical protein
MDRANKRIVVDVFAGRSQPPRWPSKSQAARQLLFLLHSGRRCQVFLSEGRRKTQVSK